MTDPRFTDPRFLSDPVIRRDEWTSGRDVDGMWSLVAVVSLLLLIGFLIFAGSGTQ